MIGKTIRKSIVTLLIIAAIFISTDCKKQLRCGCGKDVVLTLVNTSAYIYYTADKAVISCSVVGNPYSSYYFCNPTEMNPKLGDAKYGDLMLVSGTAYWDCSFVSQSSNSAYQSIQKIYQIQVTELAFDLYGKKSANPVN